MTSAAIRRTFLEFFKARGHQEVPSSSLVPADDPTLLFTNAGMVQFKRVFQGLERRDYTRAVTCQKCVRAGVHHTDDEAHKLWQRVVPDNRIYGLGDKDNFWQMADTGPCGPCSEILVDMREQGAGSGSLSLDDFLRLSEAGQLLEIWNLVFMQFD